ncbi:MAG: hypothetical protein JWL90_4267 [Chthoniobacteraceae bacterium]|nr:hypothetical protein [Chthoniobacteraceae bacterium]
MYRSTLWLAAIALTTLAGCKKQEEAFEVLQPPAAPAQLHRHWQLPDFSLIERTGRPVTSAELRGKVWVADFFYTSCPGPCPMMTSRLSEIHKATRDEKDVFLVSISTDPLKDTPDVLKQYAAKFGADERWLFLTGEKDSIYTLANKGFKLSVSDEGGTEREPVTHSTKLVLVDRNGTVRGFYDSQTEEETKKLIQDIKRLLKETR